MIQRNVNIGRVKQQRACISCRSPRINQSVEIEPTFPGYLDKPTVSSLRTAACTDVAVVTGDFVGPYNHLATITTRNRIRAQFRITPDKRAPRIRQQLPAAENESALFVATGENVAAARRPRRINARAIKNASHVADHGDLPADAAFAFCFHRARGAGRSARGDCDAAAA